MPKPKCSECKKSGKLSCDPSDGRSYCHDCWVQFYGTPPDAAAPPKVASLGAWMANDKKGTCTSNTNEGSGGMFSFADVHKTLVEGELEKQDQQRSEDQAAAAAIAGKFYVTASKKGGFPVAIEKRAKGKKVSTEKSVRIIHTAW